MSSLFYKKIHSALSDQNLQLALDGNAERRQKSFTESFSSLPEDREIYRQRAYRIRAKTIANLDHYLNQFETQANKNGLTIHHASDATQAVQIVLDIARKSSAETIIKSKTMVGEEIQINHALEESGLTVVETDLGEYIVQLRGEPPAHIITPAVHLNRADVGRTFQKELGVAFTDDVQTLTKIARKILRQTFLDADIGISGVNFGVAESGALCLVTNEGNGRMVTTLPRIHIALMGIERLVPNFDDLSLMLDILPRSATGQKITVYTTLIHSPRRLGESDGPAERHLILIDNGRRRLHLSPLNDALYCIRCGACLNACPVFREIGGHAYISRTGQITPYPGPIGSVISPGLFGMHEFSQLARASSLCGACKDACPIDIDLPKMLLRIRSLGHTSHQSLNGWSKSAKPAEIPLWIRLGMSLFSYFAISAQRFGFAQNFAGYFCRFIAPTSNWLPMPKITGWGYSRDFPKPSQQPFRQRFKNTGQNLNHSALEQNVKLEGFIEEKTEKAMINETILSRFEQEFTSLGGTFSYCQHEELANAIINYLQHQGIIRIQSWNAQNFPPGLIDDLQENGIFTQEQLGDDIQAGLTGTLAGIAETGTILVPGGVGRPLTASLLPDVHLAILHSKDIVNTISQALNNKKVKEASSVVLVSGPSRTADIEMTLSIGVHGPEHIHIFCVNP
jgi:L-lactate dehydrogenase complex protein LldF